MASFPALFVIFFTILSWYATKTPAIPAVCRVMESAFCDSGGNADDKQRIGRR